MSTNTQVVRSPRSTAVLWGWTVVSAILHALIIGALCGVSFMGHAKEEAAAKAKAAAEEQAVAKAESEAAAKSASEKPAAPAPAQAQATTAPATPAPNILPPPPEPTLPAATTTAAPPPSAEKILGIDQTAKPSDTPKSPFAGGTDDLLKDLK